MGAGSMRDARLVIDLAEARAEDRPTVGGKGASLGELTRIGVPVPPGFAATTRAFTEAVGRIDTAGDLRERVARLSLDDLPTVARVTADIRARIETAALPEEVSAALAAACAALGEDTWVAVRSSATGEDSADASYAGLQATELWVRGAEAVAASVRRCWASLYSVESVTYRLRRGLPEDGLAMGVVVQAMVDARAAGVLFTRSPTTGDRSVVVLEGCWGLGSALVSGDLTPDRFVVSKVTGEVVGRTVSSKPCRHLRDPSGAGVAVVAVPPPLRDAPCLTDDEIAELVRLARTIEGHYGVPQDVEWVVGASPGGPDIRIVQSRPETVWSGSGDRPVAAPKGRAYEHVVDRMMGGYARPTGGAR